MRYFKVPSVSFAEKVSRLFYKLMVNSTTTTTTYLFTWVKVGGFVIIQIDETMKCPVFQKDITDATLTDIAAELNNYLTPTQKNQLKTYIKSNSVVDLIQLIPTALEEVSLQWIIDHRPVLAN